MGDTVLTVSLHYCIVASKVLVRLVAPSSLHANAACQGVQVIHECTQDTCRVWTKTTFWLSNFLISSSKAACAMCSLGWLKKGKIHTTYLRLTCFTFTYLSVLYDLMPTSYSLVKTRKCSLYGLRKGFRTAYPVQICPFFALKPVLWLIQKKDCSNRV